MSQPDYEAAQVTWLTREKWWSFPVVVKAVVDAAIGELRLVSPTAIAIERDDPEYRACLQTIWERGFYGLAWDDEWYDDFADALASSQGVEDYCVVHDAHRAEEEDPLACWEYDGVKECLFVDRRAHPWWVEGYQQGEADGKLVGFYEGYQAALVVPSEPVVGGSDTK